MLLCLLMAACSKSKMPPPSSSLLLVHTVAGAKPLATNFSGDVQGYFRTAKRITYKFYNGNFDLINSYPGKSRLKLYQYPDTLAKDLPLFDLNLDLTSGSVYTLFLTGTVTEPDTILKKEEIPFFPLKDSAMAIRLINCSKGSGPVTMNLAGEPEGSAAGSCAYKQSSAFKKYPLSMSISNIVFEIRDAATGTVITTLPINNLNMRPNNKYVYRSFTVVLAGVPGGTGTLAQSAFLAGHWDQY